MIQIQQLKLPVTHQPEDLTQKICQKLKIKKEQIRSCRILRQSIDARKKQDIRYVYTVEIATDAEAKILKKIHDPSVRQTAGITYEFPVSGTKQLSGRPLIIGSGPAGLFCAYMLAKAGYDPLVVERGSSMEKRQKDVAAFWKDGILNPKSNVQFGEGGAGTFSDGKLNTLVKDPAGRNAKVLSIFTEHGAPPEICYEAKPHIGTDLLARVIPSIREEVIAGGGTFLFDTCVTDLIIKDGRICGIRTDSGQSIESETVVLAIGHSARDTFSMLSSHQIPMAAKAFAVGLRVEHPQDMINLDQYGESFAGRLPAAPYKVTGKGTGNRGVYSFCMCPGGYVVNASSQEKRLAVNGMSNYKRDSGNANSAIIVSVTPEDFGSDDVLSGVQFQKRLEERAFKFADGNIPQQLYKDFRQKRESHAYGDFCSKTCGSAAFAPLHHLFPEEIYTSFLMGMEQFGRKIKGFDREDAILSGVESRTSSPVRIHRDEQLQSTVRGLYPCGEGAGYAGGIMSAAMDGIRVAEQIAVKYAPCRKQ